MKDENKQRARRASYRRLAFFAGVFAILSVSNSLVTPDLRAQESPATSVLSEDASQGSGLTLRESPQPWRFFDATGRKSGVFGKQTGQFEAWIYPIKLLHGFRVEFQQEGMLEPLRGESLLREIVTRPESTTLVYVHPNFTAREIIWTPLNDPAIVVTFAVSASKPLDITAAFIPDFKPMWPASLGGQHSFWNPREKAFVLTDGTEKPTALVGSLTASAYSEFTDHQLAAGETMFRLHFLPQKEGSGKTDDSRVVMALSLDGEAEAAKVYRDVLARADDLFSERVQHHRDFLSRTLAFESPDVKLNQEFAWAKVTLDSGWVCHPKFGCGLIAGYGPAGVGERPGFDWWFGGDAMISSWALEDLGDLEGARQALRFLKNRQRDDGKILHEMTQSVDLLDWFGKYHYAYYHADSTPMYLYSLGQYWRRTHDPKFLEEFWPSAQKAYAYCLSTVTSEDGLMDNTKAGLAAVEVGVLRGKVVKDIYLEGFWLAGLESMALLAQDKGEKSISEDAQQRSAKAAASLENNWWDADRHAFTFGITADGQRTDLFGVWPSIALALSTEVKPSQAREGAKIFASPEIATDWGARWLSNRDALYDPLSYNNGTAWAFMSGFAAWAEYEHGLPLAAFSLWSSIANLTSLSSPGGVPELMNGDRFLPGEFAVPHQLFSSDGVILPAVRGLLGLASTRSSFTGVGPSIGFSFAPQIPADWPYVRFRNFAIGAGHVDGEAEQTTGAVTMRVKYKGESPITADLFPSVPAAARVKTVRLDGKPLKFSTRDRGSALRIELAPIELTPEKPATLLVEYEGGIAIVPPQPDPAPGDSTTSLKILDVQSASSSQSCLLQITAAGLGGHTYPLRLISTLPHLRAGDLEIHKTERGYELALPFEGRGYMEKQICLGN